MGETTSLAVQQSPGDHVRRMQIYLSNKPVTWANGPRTLLQVDAVYCDLGKARVVDPTSIYHNYRPRLISLSQLHISGLKRDGTERVTGYSLHSEIRGDAHHLCLHCFCYVTVDELDDRRSTTCQPCARELHERYGNPL